MQRSLSCMTTPSERWYVAWTGQTFTHGALAQCWHASGTQRIAGSPCSMRGVSSASPSVRMRFHQLPIGTWFSDLQITAHDQQPMHRSVSTTMPQCGASDGGSTWPHAREAGGSASIGDRSGIGRTRHLADLDAAVLPAGRRAPHVRHEVDLVDGVHL